MDEIDAGAIDGLTFDEFRTTYPHDFAARKADKLRYRYYRGESYEVCPFLMARERVRDLLIGDITGGGRVISCPTCVPRTPTPFPPFLLCRSPLHNAQDVISRLESVTVELERQQLPMLIVGHRAIVRCIYGFLKGIPKEDIPHLEIPLHTVFKLQPTSYGLDEERIALMDDVTQ